MALYVDVVLLFILISCQLLIINSGNIPKSLYDSTDAIVQLDNVTISKVLFNSENCWIVEFYSSWCGHCIRFAPMWKQLAKDLKAWKSVIGVASIDCAVKHNFETCRRFKIEGYPTIKFFNASSSNNTGTKMKGGRQSDIIRHAMIDHIENHSNKIRPEHWPSLKPIKLSEVLAFQASPPAKYLAIIFEDENSYIGREVILDMTPYLEFKVARATKNSTALIEELKVTNFPSLYIFYPDGKARELKSTPDPTRESFRSLLLELIGLSDQQHPPELKPAPEGKENVKEEDDEKIKNYDANTETNKDLVNFLGMDAIPGMERQPAKQNGKQDTKVAWDAVKRKQEVKAEQLNLLRNRGTFPQIQMQDLESALTYALRQEVPLKDKIEASALEALRSFVSILNKYFPGRNHVSGFLESLDFWLMDQKGTFITADEWLDFVNENYDPEKAPNAILPHEVKWKSCMGSSARYRGYPCSLWMLFHTLTVSSAKINKQNPNGNSQEVLQAMQGYVREFFTCKECVENFAKESQLMSSTVTSYDMAILWLWKTHNKVNLRLKGDMSEDPAHPKIQFPPEQFCTTCRLGKGHENEWDNAAVLQFLKEYYGIRNIAFDRIYPHGNIANVKERDPPEKFMDLSDLKIKQEVMRKELEKQLEVRLSEDRIKHKSTTFYDIDITSMDLSMCIFMYSICILFCFLIYIVICRRKRRKVIKQKV